MAKITAQNTEITVSNVNGEDYICITDMLKAKDGDFFVTDWLRNRNTMEFIGVWERIYNPNFNYGEFATIRNQAGLPNFVMCVSEWIEKTNAIASNVPVGINYHFVGSKSTKELTISFSAEEVVQYNDLMEIIKDQKH